MFPRGEEEGALHAPSARSFPLTCLSFTNTDTADCSGDRACMLMSSSNIRVV